MLLSHSELHVLAHLRNPEDPPTHPVCVFGNARCVARFMARREPTKLGTCVKYNIGSFLAVFVLGWLALQQQVLSPCGEEVVQAPKARPLALDAKRQKDLEDPEDPVAAIEEAEKATFKGEKEEKEERTQ